MTAASPPLSVTTQVDVPATMRDGVVLRANVYRPDGDGPWATLLTRTPYDKDDPLGAATLDPVRVAQRGFMVVVQDTRGRFASDGEWSPLRFEREDGYDAVEWAARLPGSNGRVGMYGSSYCGNTQWMAALEQPPSLAANRADADVVGSARPVSRLAAAGVPLVGDGDMVAAGHSRREQPYWRWRRGVVCVVFS
jgi:predicted acyl esterase